MERINSDVSVMRVWFGGVILLGLCACLSACIGGANRPVQLLSSNGPVYPASAKARGLQGYVLVEYTVSIEGVVLNPKVIESEPAGVFDTAAIIAVASWVYKPMVVNGEKQRAERVQSRVEFRLGEPERYQNY